MIEKLKSLKIGELEIKIPIIQGAMGVMISRSSLASAVANCGGAGTIASVGLGYGTNENETNYLKASREGLQKEVRRARELSQGVIGVNIMVALSNYEDLIQTAAQEKIDFISSGAGLPLKLPEFSEKTSIKLIPIVSSDRAAAIIIKTWKKRYNRFPDAIIVEGPLAGGHLGFKFENVVAHEENMLEHLIVDVLKVVRQYEGEFNVNIPVIAAGGIFEGKDAAKFFKLGVSGIQMATRFVATFECSVTEGFKKKYLAAKEEDVVIIKSPVGMPGRALKTKLINQVMNGERVPFECNYQCLKTCEPRTVPYCIAKALFNAVSGDLENAVVFAGHNVSRVNKIVSVKELMDEIASQAVDELNKSG